MTPTPKRRPALFAALLLACSSALAQDAWPSKPVRVIVPFAPAGTPAAVSEKVQREVAKVMAETEIKARLYVQGMSPVVNSSAAFTRQIDQELERWAKVVAARKLQAN
jgi:tripartite-type tricarboxylate transporter receptor subunit TctC